MGRTIKRIHVNQFVIRDKGPEPITVITSKENEHGSNVEILDKDGNVVAVVVYRPEKPLSCGAKVWIETRSELVVT